MTTETQGSRTDDTNDRRNEMGKKLRTRIADLQAVEIGEGELGQIAGGGLRIAGAVIGVCKVRSDKCWQPSASVTNPGEPDTAQDYVTD